MEPRTRNLVSTVIGAGLGIVLVSACLSSGATRSASPLTERGSVSSGCPAATGPVAAPQLTTGKSTRDCPLKGRLVTYEGVGVYVPTPGTGVSASADSADGGVSLNVFTSPDGVVTADVDGPESQAPKPPAAAVSGSSAPAGSAQIETASLATATDPACSMTARRFNGWSWDTATTAKFLVNTTEGRPANISGTTFLSVQRVAAASISAAYNNCGIVARPSIRIAFSATTTANSGIRGTTNTCMAPDRRNVLDFGNLTGSILALNCTWYQAISGRSYARITESDSRFDNSSRSWVTTMSGCTGSRYDLLSAATHEMGHWVGLGHVAETGGQDLTMSSLIGPCNSSSRTLGRGDITSLLVPY